MNLTSRNDTSRLAPSPKQKWDVCRFSITVVITVIILIANLIVTYIYMVMKKCDRRKIPNYCLFHQSLVDIVVGVVFLLYELYTSHLLDDGVITPFEYHMYRYTKFVCKPFTVILCVATLIMNTGDRYLAIKHPLQRRRHSSLRQITVWTIVVWLLSLVMPLITFWFWKCDLLWYDYRHNCTTPNKTISLPHMKVIEHSIALIGMFLVLLTLYLTYNEIRKSFLNPFANFEMVNITSDIGVAHHPENTIQQQFISKERKAFDILLRMAVVYIITYLPMGVTSIIWNSTWPRSRDFGLGYYIFKEVCELVYVLSAMVNPFITLTMKPGFRDVVINRLNGLKNRISVRSRTFTTLIIG